VPEPRGGGGHPVASGGRFGPRLAHRLREICYHTRVGKVTIGRHWFWCLLVALGAMGLSVVAFATHSAGARTSLVSAGPSTKELVDPLYTRAIYSQDETIAARKSIQNALHREGADRIRYEQAAVAELGHALSRLDGISLPQILDSPFVRRTIRDIQNLEKRARRSVTTVGGLAAAERALDDAEVRQEELLSYLGLTVIRIEASFERPVTEYHAYLYSRRHRVGTKYKWSNSNDCGDFAAVVLIGVVQAAARWSHPDSNDPGACPVQVIHPGTITVVASTPEFSCTGVYHDGSAPGNEESPAEAPCTVR
jgi:hypothetical protein